MRPVVETLIPTTMVGSYPRPRWYQRRAWGHDLQEVLMEQNWREEYEDAVKAVINDQETAGLDIVSDGEMFEDDLCGAAGWPEYVFQRLGGTRGRTVSPSSGVVDSSPIMQYLFTEAWPNCWGRPYGQWAYGHAGDFRPMFANKRLWDARFHVLNIECGDCLGPEMELLEQVPADRAVAIGVLNHRVLQVETAEEVAAKIRRALKHISPERLYLTSFCGLGTTLPRTIAFYKLKALADGARIVRAELTDQRQQAPTGVA